MHRWLALLALNVVVAAVCACGEAVPGESERPSAAATPDVAAARERLPSVIEDVRAADGYRYGLRDDVGHVMDTAKIIWVPEEAAFAAVYHAVSDSDRAFHTHLATSTDLLTWHWRLELAEEASMPTIEASDDGGYVITWDPTTVAMTFTAPVFLYYATWTDVLAGDPTKRFAVDLSLSTCGEGTANLYSASSTFLDVGFHYYADCEVDREGRGTTDWTTWNASPQPRLQDPILDDGVAGGVGDRDDIRFEGEAFTIVEAQRILGDWRTFGVYLFDDASGEADRLDIRTHAGSTAFTNPTVSLVEFEGRPTLVVTLFVPQEGAHGDEAGELLYYRFLDQSP